MSNYDFAANYRRLSADKLTTLVKESNTLVEEAIPALRNELVHRRMTEQVVLLDKLIANEKQRLLTQLSKAELQKVIAQRLAGGESIQDLRTYLRENGVSTYDIVVDGEEETTISVDSAGSKGNSKSEIEIVKAPPLHEYIGYDGRIMTRKEINVYRDTGLTYVLRKEAPNKMIAFTREIIRDGRELLMIKEPDGENSFIENIESDVLLCMQCQTVEHPIDFLLISHDDYKKHLFAAAIERTELSAANAQDIFSNVSPSGNFLHATTINHSKKKVNAPIIASTVTFDSAVANKIKIGRLEPDSKFYIVPQNDINAIQLITGDGREGVLLEGSVSFKTISNSLETFVNVIVFLIVMVIFGGAIFIIAVETGYLVIIGLVAILLFFLVRFFIGVPLYLFLRSVLRRL